MELPSEIASQNDVMTVVLSYLSRKKKFAVRQLSKSFRDSIVPMSMVTLQFKGVDTLLSKGSLFSLCVQSCRKVEKLSIDSVDITLPYAKALIQCLSEQRKFTERVRHLNLANLSFVPDDPSNDLQRHFIIGTFCQALALFDGLECLEFENVGNIGAVMAFYNKLPVERMGFLRTVRHLNVNACPVLTDEDQDMTFIELKEFVTRCTDIEGS